VPPPEPFEWRRWKSRIPAIALLFPFLALTVGGLAVGSDAFTRAKEYEAAAAGAMEGYEGLTREDMETLRIREMRRAIGGWLLVPFGLVGLAAALGELARSTWTRPAYRRCGVLGILIGIAQIVLLRGQIGAMWTLGVFTAVFGVALLAYAARAGLPSSDGDQAETAEAE